ncbi:hypothetical protein [Streptomyces sp. GbtcB7]|uniref:hypothetical protein n=1 Tax=Streptomyces sp. GbtcB7 TaxID=2824752 RepID=UPI001C30E825|nr:hypothetical protein [Streptomyces sp. GbtcB7]
MTNTAILHHPHVGRVINALCRPAVIRLVSEIDDNGPISRSRGSLRSAFGDLTTHQLRHAIDVARTLGVVHAGPHATARYRLTPAGEDLAALYDTAARWSRTHQYPSTASDFVTRVQHTLKLLGDGGAVLPAEAAFALPTLQSALAEWLRTHPQVLHAVASRSSHAADETEHAA